MFLRLPIVTICILIKALDVSCSMGAEPPTVGQLKEAVNEASVEIMKTVGDKKVSVGEFTATGKRNLNSGPLVAELLKEKLENLKPNVVVREDAPFEVKGQYLFTDSPEPMEQAAGQKVIRFDFEIRETQTGHSVRTPISTYIRNNTEIIQILGVNGHIPSDPNPKDQTGERRKRNTGIQGLILKPQFFIDPKNPSRVSTSKESPFQLEVLSAPSSEENLRPVAPLKVTVKDGMPFIDLKKDDRYELKFYSKADEEVAIKVFIDGINMFYFSDDRDEREKFKPKFSHLIVPPAQNDTEGVSAIPGWHKSVSGDKNFLSFLVTSYGKGASQKIDVVSTGQVGVIQVQISRCYPAGSKSASANETGFGPPLKIEQTPQEREIDSPSDIITIRYSK